MKEREKIAHMKSAFNYAELSYCIRKQVGCIVVKDNRIISIGYNGTPPGWENCCEDREDMPGDTGGWLAPEDIERTWPLVDENGKRYRLVSKPEVYHAEANAIAKLARSPESGKDASVFITCSPCIDCAKLLAQVGVKEVFYAEEYKSGIESAKGASGTEFLRSCGIPTDLINIEQQ